MANNQITKIHVGNTDYDVVDATAQRKLTAGNNITISDNNVISATVDSIYVSKNSTLTGNGSTKKFDIENDFGTADVMVSVRDNATGKDVIADITKTSSTISVEFAVAPASGSTYRVNIFSGLATATLEDANARSY